MTEYTSQQLETRIIRDSSKALPTVYDTADAYELIKELQDEAVEKFVAMFLNVRHKVLALVVLFSGGMTEAVIDVRLIVKTALDIGATAIIVAHNHPSGDTRPSQEDIKITQKIKESAGLFDIDLIDHLVVGLNSYESII